MEKFNNSINTRFTVGNRPNKSIACEVLKGPKPGVYASIGMAAKANRMSRSTLYDIAHGKFKREGIEVVIMDV